MQYRTSSARTISFSRFRTRAWRKRRRSTPTSSGWRKSWASRMVATNDCHYLCEDDSHAHDVLLCVQTGKSIDDPNRLQVRQRPVLREERATRWRGSFRTRRTCSSARMEIAERCNFKLNKVENPFPEFAVPEGHTIDSYFEQVCREGLHEALETAVRQLEVAGRLQNSRRRVRAAAGARNRHHQADEVLRLLPDRLGLHPLRAGERHSGGSGPWFGGRIAGGLLHGDHGHRSAAE